MFDIIGAGLIARAFGRRAAERGKSRTGVGVLVLLVIMGTEIAVGLLMRVRGGHDSMLGGFVLGWVLGAMAACIVGALATTGPVTHTPGGSPLIEGRDCYECERTIVNAGDGEACSGCKHALHHRCMREHARAHVALEESRGRAGRAEHVKWTRLANEPRVEAVDVSASPASVGSLAGHPCAECTDEIVLRHQGETCEVCDRTIHRACAAEHKAKHAAPFRRSAKSA